MALKKMKKTLKKPIKSLGKRKMDMDSSDDDEEAQNLLDDLSEKDMDSDDEEFESCEEASLDDEGNEDDGNEFESDSDEEEEKVDESSKKSEVKVKEEQIEDGSDEEEKEEQKPPKPSLREIKEKRLGERRANEKRTIFVGNVPPETPRRTIRKMFRQFGKIDAVYQRTLLQMNEKLATIVVNKRRKKNEDVKPNLTSTNFYVRFSNEKEAETAVEKMKKTVLEGHNLRITMSAQNKFKSALSIHVRNLPYIFTEDQVRDFFSQCGEIRGVRLMHDSETGRNTGVGFVEFKKKESVRKALALHETQKIGGRKVCVYRTSKNFRGNKSSEATPSGPNQGRASWKSKANNLLGGRDAKNFLVLKDRKSRKADLNSSEQPLLGSSKPKRMKKSKLNKKQKSGQQGGKRKSLIT